MYKGNWKFKNARTSLYDGTESRDTSSSEDIRARLNHQQTMHSHQTFASVQL